MIENVSELSFEQELKLTVDMLRKRGGDLDMKALELLEGMNEAGLEAHDEGEAAKQELLHVCEILDSLIGVKEGEAIPPAMLAQMVVDRVTKLSDRVVALEKRVTGWHVNPTPEEVDAELRAIVEDARAKEKTRGEFYEDIKAKSFYRAVMGTEKKPYDV